VLIDVHNHVMPGEALDVLRRDPGYGVTIDGDRWTGVHHVPFTITPAFHDPLAKIAEMDARGIGSAVVSCPPPLFFYEVSSDRGADFCTAANVGMAKMCSGCPDRLRWLANLPLQDPPRAAGLYRAALGQGCVGAAVGTSIAGQRLDEPRFEEFWAAAEQAGRPVLIHPAFNEPRAALEPYYLQNVIGNPLETTVMVERMICAGVPATRDCGWSSCTVAATCHIRPDGWPTRPGSGRRSRYRPATSGRPSASCTSTRSRMTWRRCGTWPSASVSITCCWAPTGRSTWPCRHRPPCWPRRSTSRPAARSAPRTRPGCSPWTACAEPSGRT
jgi:hypothetical protein